MENEKNYNSLITELKEILAHQSITILPCEAKLGCNFQQYNTIPILLRCKKNCKLFFGTGVFEDPTTKLLSCFRSPFFRICKIYSNDYMLLELLQLESSDEIENNAYFFEANSLCDCFPAKSFIRTGCCIKVKIECFCSVECLSPICAKHGTPKKNPIVPKPIRVENSEYIAISDGLKRIYLNQDGIEGYNQILNPNMVSYTNLFINGMLQPQSFYSLKEGQLTIDTEDVPMNGTYIILQFIKIKK